MPRVLILDDGVLGSRWMSKILQDLKNNRRKNNVILKFLQSKLSPEDKKEGIFYITLQRQIDDSDDKYGRPKKEGNKKNLYF